MDERRLLTGCNRCYVVVSDPDGYEFFIVSLDNKQWHFEASNSEERDDWVSAIEQQILNSLQGNEISKSRSRFAIVDSAVLIAVKNKVPGNGYCVDCDAPSNYYHHYYIAK